MAQIEHCFLEPPAGIAFVDPDGVLTVMVCTQYPHYHHKQIARVLGRPMDKVRVVQTVVGGGFGGKMDNTVEIAIALLALKTERPVRMVYTREEVFTATTKRHPMKVKQRLGATRDGKFTALDAEYLLDGGAYRSYSITVSGRCVIHAGMPYMIPNLRVDLTTAFTNHVPCGAMRSFGIVKTAFALECQISEMAARLGLSPIEIRRRNGFVDGDTTATGQTLHDVGLLKTLDALEPIYRRRKAEIAAAPKVGSLRRGLGVACLGYGIGYSGVRNPSTARIRVDGAGTVTAYCGTPRHRHGIGHVAGADRRAGGRRLGQPRQRGQRRLDQDRRFGTDLGVAHDLLLGQRGAHRRARFPPPVRGGGGRQAPGAGRPGAAGGRHGDGGQRGDGLRGGVPAGRRRDA